MSLVHNMKQTFENVLITTPIENSEALLLVSFYMSNPNSKEEEIRKFAEENKINSEMVRIFK